jgi:hypothetical protein
MKNLLMQDMKQTIRFFFMLMALMMGATSELWAQEPELTESDIVIDDGIEHGTVAFKSLTDRTVTLTITPDAGYYIKASDIVVEKLVDPGNANAPERRTPAIADVIPGTMYSGSGRTDDDIISSVANSNSAEYDFTVPADYNGVYVTATFHLITETENNINIIRITRSTDLGSAPSMTDHYILVDDVDASVVSAFYSAGTFTGIFEGEAQADGTFPKITGLSTPLFNTLTGTVKNIMLEGVGISNHTGNTGAIACTANGAARIYNVGILSGSVDGTGNTGGLVGFLDGTARVINCYSYANITGGDVVGGIVGNNNQTSSQTALNTIVVNCMFYGNITGGNSVYPVYGGRSINNDSNTGINPYCYFRKNATLTPTAYNRSWPAEEKNLTRFEYYRSVLNSNRKLCTWWVNGTSGTAPTDEDVANVGIAKWVLDPSIAPYPILKKWGKYPSVINLDPDKVWDPRTEIKEGDAVTSVTPHWVQRSDAKEWEGKSYGTLAVTIKAGAHGSGSTSRNIPITDMDTLNCDYSYYKIQLPYYNEVFGNPNGATHAEKYGGNYTEYVVTGWEIEAAGSTTATDYNFADRNSINGRVFAQGGYYYVPKDVTSITITARWGKAFYLSNRGRSIDRVNVTKADYKADSPFTPAGTIPDTFQDQPVYDDLQNAIKALGTNTDSPTVYDQAIVLIGNHQVKNGNNDVGYNLDSKWHPFTIMSADFDFDNEPDYSFQFQFRVNTPRPGIQPIRFDFLPVVELGLALRHDYKAYAIGIFVPQGHFEVTETAFMRTTQFEYDGFQSYTDRRIEAKSPVIINGGEYEMFVVRYHDSNRTSYFLLGGNAWIHRFAPGAHPSNASPKIYLCPINVIGGQVKELYLTGLYRPKLLAPTNQGAPRCYTDGGKFDIMAGAGYEKVEAGSNVTFKINHSKITEFYGGGINATNPISGNINVTIDNSYVDKYCGGPKVGDMTGKTVTTHATGTTFGVFYGGGNGGNSYYRDLQKDGDMSSDHIGTWNDQGYNWDGFNPLGVKDDGTDNKGYHAEYEFEVFNHSNGVTDQITQRGFIRWIQFGITKTGNVSSTLSDCKILGNFYGGGNLATVDGNVTSTLTNTQVAGSVFGAGYSAAIPTFQVHDKSTASFPSITAGVITDGYIGYDSKVYEWTNEKLEGKDEAYMKAHPTYEKDGKWYCYTWNSLDDLGAVTGNATLTINGTTTVGESVYGGGQESNVEGKTQVNITGGTITQNVFGGGMGVADNFACSKAMVGVNDAGKCADPGSAENKDKGTKVSISNGTVNGNVYGGGEVGRVEWNTQVEIGVGTGDGPFAPEINGSVFGAGKGKETHGYAALVRGNSSVTIQGKAKVRDNVYGGGEQATVGRYWVKGINTTLCPNDENETAIPTPPDGLPDEMPYKTRRGGKCTVIVQGEAQIGPNDGPTEIAGHVFGAGKGVTPAYNNTQGDNNRSKRMVDYKSGKHTGDPGTTWDYYPDDHNYVWEYFATEDKYFEFLQTLALATGTDVTINGSAKVKGSVYGGSESGYVQDDTDVKVKGGTIGTEDLGGAYYGNVYGGGKGDAKHMGAEKKYVAAGLVKGNTKVKIENGTILHNIYGGGAYGSVGEFTYDANGRPTGRKTYTVGETVESTTGGNTEITITGGTIGSDGHENGMVFGSSRGDVAAPGTDGVDPNDRMAWVYSTHVKIGDTNVQSSPTIKGSVYGSGENGHTFQNTIVDVNKGIIGITDTSVDGGAAYAYRGNVYGGGCGTDKYDSDGDKTADTYNPLAGIVQGTATVNITGGQVVHNVYGAGAMGSVGGGADANSGKTTINISGGRIGYDGVGNGHIFGAARGEFGVSDAASNLANVRETEVNINYATTPAADNEGKTEQLIAGSVFGGGEAGTVKGSVAVKMTGGLILNDVYGGGALADTQTSNWNADANNGAGGWADAEKSALHTTTVRLTGGTILGEAYGGGLGETGKPAYVWGDVLLDLNGTTSSGETGTSIVDNDDDARGCAVSQVFGCNNAAGTPKGDVLVHVYATQNKNKSQIANSAATVDTPAVTDAKQKGVYDVSAVYGGGNLAAYEPADPDNNKTEVVIDGCELTSIKQVYGGGNAACAPSTNVTVNGTFEVEELFGGGNGLDNIVINGVTKPNPGANVGYKNYSEYYYEDNTWKVRDMAAYDTKDKRMAATDLVYGTGKASVNIYGGTVHRVFGGSNTKGNVRQTALTLLDDNEGCTFCVDEAYGGGKSAEMDAEAKLLMACIPGLEAVYGGAEAADVRGNVTLNITNGTFDRVFGGNNLSGTISGSITVNVEEIGCKPVKIGELYGGGNQAGYSVYGYDSDGKPKETVEPGTNPLYDDPQVNVMSFTSIGNVYGGGYGEGATMVGNPTVNINEAYGKYYNEDVSVVGENAKTPNNYPIPSHAKGKMGAISNVFGGGNAAKVIGSTTVNIGTLKEVYLVKEVTADTTLPDGCYIRKNDGTYSSATGPASADVTYYEKKTVQGVDIRGNVYGGGNNAEVTGNTNVIIGKQAE